MAKARTFVRRLKAVKNIKKITRTMELIATARFKKAMDRATEAAAYTKKIAEIVSDLSKAELSFSHPLLTTPATCEKTVLLTLTSNRGLCGGYNGGVLRHVTGRLREAKESNEQLQLDVCGKRGLAFMKFQGLAVTHAYTNFEDKPLYDEIEAIADRYVAAFVKGDIQRLQVAYTKFQSASRQVPVLETLLPIGNLDSGATTDHSAQPVEYEFLPSPQDILEEIVPAAFKARLFKCFLDAAVSEQIARMVAMKGATENASDMIALLSKQYNRARQSQITSELSEIIGGAAALD